jgi:ferredoxin
MVAEPLNCFSLRLSGEQDWQIISTANAVPFTEKLASILGLKNEVIDGTAKLVYTRTDPFFDGHLTLIEEIDVIHPIINQAGLGILDGTVGDMLAAIDYAVNAGKGIYGMKALGGGHLGQNAEQAFSWILNQQSLASIVVGMQTPDEVAVNCAIFEGRKPNPKQVAAVTGRKRSLLIEDWCAGCGQCAARCPMGALTLEQGRAVVDQERCVLCGYCASVCSEFCLKVI